MVAQMFVEYGPNKHFLNNIKKIGNFKNKMVAGLDYYNQRIINNSTGYANQGFVYIGTNNDEFAAVAPALRFVETQPHAVCRAARAGQAA